MQRWLTGISDLTEGILPKQVPGQRILAPPSLACLISPKGKEKKVWVDSDRLTPRNGIRSLATNFLLLELICISNRQVFLD